MELMWPALISLILVHAIVFPFRLLESFILFIRGLFEDNSTHPATLLANSTMSSLVLGPLYG